MPMFSRFLILSLCSRPTSVHDAHAAAPLPPNHRADRPELRVPDQAAPVPEGGHRHWDQGGRDQGPGEVHHQPPE